MVIDPHGKSHNPVRHIDGVKAREFNEIVSDLDRSALPDANDVIAGIKSREPKEERGRSAFEELAKKQIDLLIDKHRHEREKLILQHKRRIASAKTKLARYYGLPNQKKELATLKRKVENAPWWKKLLGLSKKDEHLFQERQKNYRQAHGRYREKLSGLKEQGHTALSDLKKRHSRETMELKLFLDMARTTRKDTNMLQTHYNQDKARCLESDVAVHGRLLEG